MGFSYHDAEWSTTMNTRVTPPYMDGIERLDIDPSLLISTNRDQFRYAPSRFETLVHCNDVSHWMVTYLDLPQQ